jgi:glycosyltransferase involved in cell wall biosynthesis
MSITGKKTIVYVYPHISTFIQRDMEMLGVKYNLIPYDFSSKSKWMVPWQFFRQFVFLLIQIFKTDTIICHFAGYSSFLPSLFCKIFGKPCFIIVAGTDGARFSDFNYGNFNKKLLGWFTGASLRMATKVLPVHESLVYQDYDYYDGGKPAQGFGYFYPKAAHVPFHPVYYGYNFDDFKILDSVVRKPASFIAVGNLNEKDVFRRKGFDLVINFAGHRPELSFTLVGWDGKKPLAVPSNVSLLRYMSTPDLVKLMNEHEFFLNLSLMEGFPNALAEAMLCGCIPMGSNVSGIPFIIGDAGYILDRHDLQQLNVLVDKALTDPARTRLPLMAHNRIKENFPMERRLRELEQVINSGWKK